MKTAGHGQAKVLTAPEIHRLFQEGLYGERDRALFGLCLYTGCRINEDCTRLTRDVYRESGSVRSIGPTVTVASGSNICSLSHG